jgi:hypothetical protein
MFKNYLVTAWRNIKKSKATSALNILGLAAFTAEQKTKEIGIRQSRRGCALRVGDGLFPKRIYERNMTNSLSFSTRPC